MTSWKIVADSSCDLRGYQPEQPEIAFATVPLKIQLGEISFVDDQTLDPLAMLDQLDASPEPSSSACPSPEEWRREFLSADHIIAITISSSLSGSYNSATLARNLVLEQYPQKRIYVLDSRSTSGQMALLVRKAQQLISAGLPFDQVGSQLEAYNQELNILFVLCSFQNLAKNGRISKVVGFFATKLNMRVIGGATPAGAIDLLYKIRGENATMEKLIKEIKRLKDLCGKDVVISHCNNLPGAQQIKQLLEKAYQGVKVTILATGGLTSYYAERFGLIISF